MSIPADHARDTDTAPVAARRFCVLVFDDGHLLAAVRDASGALSPTIEGAARPGSDIAQAAGESTASFLGAPAKVISITKVAADAAGDDIDIFFVMVPDSAVRLGNRVRWHSVAELETLQRGSASAVSPRLRAVLAAIEPHLIRIPYLNFSESEYVYRFRTDDQRNLAIYTADDRGRRLYQSALCAAIKAAKRQKERTADSPALLDFGAVRYVLPSHFGFCLGVQNAIERAYETIAENPGRRVFMISELIHNPFVNDDLRARGLINLQSDRGVPVKNPQTGRDWWDELERGDIVLTPAFGATDEDKVRLIRRGIAVNRYDATCMLVEKVWKAARRYSQAGFTVVIHGKSEHEETKATFSNCAKYGASVILRDRHEAEILGAVILADDRADKERLFAPFRARATPGFDVERDLQKLALVNQTTLLRNETVGIIDYLEQVMVTKYGPSELGSHIHNKSRGDTLCYATQVNQDALERALASGADAAIVVGGKNSSNTFQLYRICEARHGARAFYIQSEKNLLSLERAQHYHFPYKPDAPGAGSTVERDFLPAADRPHTILITGGASCPDGIIQQVITRINGFYPPEKLRPIESVLAEIS